MVRRLRERVGTAGQFEEGAQGTFTGLQLADGELAVGVGDVSGRVGGAVVESGLVTVRAERSVVQSVPSAANWACSGSELQAVEDS